MTLSSHEQNQTGKTDLTDLVSSNADVLAAVFPDTEDAQRPFALGFSGNPQERKAWGGDAYRSGKTNTANEALNWYFTLAVYQPNQ